MGLVAEVWDSLQGECWDWGKSTPFLFMYSPISQDWGDACPHTYLASYRLEYDRSWTPAEEVEERTKDIDAIDRAIHAHTAISYITRT